MSSILVCDLKMALLSDFKSYPRGEIVDIRVECQQG